MLRVFPRSLPSPPNLAPTSIRALMSVYGGAKLGVLGALQQDKPQKAKNMKRNHKATAAPPAPSKRGVSFKQHFAWVVTILGKIYNIYDLAVPRGFQPCFFPGVPIAGATSSRCNNSNIPQGAPARKAQIFPLRRIRKEVFVLRNTACVLSRRWKRESNLIGASVLFIYICF